MNKSNIELPKLPYGEGSMSFMPDNKTIIYKKSYKGKRLSVYGETPKECMTKMRAKEKEVESKQKEKISGIITLEDAIKEWHREFKKPGVALKDRSYDREYNTIKNQILKYTISKMQIQAITEVELQKHINKLIEESYSYSTVKKTYEALNQFFKYYYAKAPNDNPMNLVNKPTKSAMNVQEKVIEYFDEDDIKVFVKEATRTYSNGKPVYRLGHGLVAVMYTGMRINEALALRWQCIDFDNNTITINSNRARVVDRTKEPREDGTLVYKTIYTGTKNNQSRNISMTQKAKDSFLKLKEIQKHNDNLDFVFSTSTGRVDSERNLRRALNNIQERANTKVQNSGLHLLRHTFCSLLCRKGVDEGVVAALLGQQDREMVKRVYRHVSENEKIKAVQKIESNEDIIKLEL